MFCAQTLKQISVMLSFLSSGGTSTSTLGCVFVCLSVRLSIRRQRLRDFQWNFIWACHVSVSFQLNLKWFAMMHDHDWHKSVTLKYLCVFGWKLQHKSYVCLWRNWNWNNVALVTAWQNHLIRFWVFIIALRTKKGPRIQ